MDSLKKVNLTEQDFDLIIAGLDAIPAVGMASDMMLNLTANLLSEGSNIQIKEKIKSELIAFKKKQEGKNKLQSDEIKILQGKLITLKRILIENNLMGNVTEILK